MIVFVAAALDAQDDTCRVTSPEPRPRDLFGCAVALNEDSLLVGSLLDDSRGEDSGAAYLYERSSGELGKTLCPEGMSPGARFGYSVALSDSHAVVGAPFHDAGQRPGAGAAYVFDLRGSGCLSGRPLSPPTLSAQDQVGFSVAVDGALAAVGAPGADRQGAVYLFRHDGSAWIPLEPVEAEDGQGGDGFGFVVALDGGLLVVGAPFAGTTGRVYAFELSQRGSATRTPPIEAGGAAPGDRFGFAVATFAETVVAAAPGKASGAVYVFTPRKNAGRIVEWRRRARLPPAGVSGGAALGVSVAVAAGPSDDKRIVVGARFDGAAGPEAGAAFLFRGDAGAWSEPIRIASGAAGDELGLGVALDADLAVVGAFKRDVTRGGESFEDAGAACAFPLEAPPPSMPPPDLSFTKNARDATTSPGAYLTYTLTYANSSGASTAESVVITETVPDHTTATSPEWQCDDVVSGSVCTYDAGDVPGGGGGSVDFTVLVEDPIPADVDEVFNEATITADNAETDPSHTATETTPVVAVPVLRISNRDGGVTATPGDVLRYDLVVRNRGRRNATGVTIHETVPENATFDNERSTRGWSCAEGALAGSPCTFDVAGELAGGSRVAATFAVKVDDPIPANVEEITNQVTVTADNAPSHMVSRRTPIEAVPELALKIDDGDVTVEPGDVLLYTIEVANDGHRNAVGVVIEETVPASTTFRQGGKGSAGWSCADGAPAGSLCSYSLGEELVGGADGPSIEFAVVVDAAVGAGVEVIENLASVRAGNGAPIRGADSTPVDAAPALAISKTADRPAAEPGTVITYEIAYANDGNQDAEDVEIRETIPRGTRFEESESSPGWLCPDAAPGTPCSFVVPALKARETGETTFALRVEPSATLTAIVNEVEILAGGEAEPARDSETTPLVLAPLFGQLFVSVDGGGSTDETYEVEVEKPSDEATVRSALLVAVTTEGCALVPDECDPIADGDVLLGDSPVTWDDVLLSDHVSAYTQRADVTSLVKPRIDMEEGGRYSVVVTETSTAFVEGVALAVVFEDPEQPELRTVSLNVLAPDPARESFVLTLAEPVGDEEALADMGIGIASGARGCPGIATRNTKVEVDGRRFANTAGGTDDGGCGPGERMTVGGLEDSREARKCNPGSNARDDELYSLLPCISDDATRLVIDIGNCNKPTDCDGPLERVGNNVFLVYFQLSGLAVVGEGILLAPATAIRPVGTTHEVTARLLDGDGEVVPGAAILFEVLSGPNVGLSVTETTGSDGEVRFTYIGAGGVGVDRIRAMRIDEGGEPLLVSNVALCEWE